MKRISTKALFILFLFYAITAQAAENRLRAMGGLSCSVPDISAQINLFQIAGNRALLMRNDTLSWLYYRTDGFNNWGNLKRVWDAEREYFYDLSFSGQKKIGRDQMFAGDICYIWDYRGEQQYAIEKYPYAADPFVLADYTSGDLLFHGPRVSVSFSQNAGKGWFLGVGLNYSINRGLKNIPTEPEIISREIRATLDAAWQVSDQLTFGLSLLPWQVQDITKLVTLSNGLEPTTRRYRGEFEFREKTGTADRTVNSAGYEWRPQMSWRNRHWEIAVFGRIGIQNQELYDGTTQHHYDGYFQQLTLGGHSVARYLWSGSGNQTAFVRYIFEYEDGWAREPQQKLLFFRKYDRRHRLVVGGSMKISASILAAVELMVDYRVPRQIDFLAHRNRSGIISNIGLHGGFEYELNPDLFLRGGFQLNNYYENEVWQYFGNYSGACITAGFGWRFSRFEIDTAMMAGRWFGSRQAYRNHLNINFQMKQYF